MTMALNASCDDGMEFDIDCLIMPIGDNGVGEDPRYGDYFDIVKSEIDRLSNTDYPEVIKNCRFILEHEAKDIRIAGYYLLAMVFSHGLNGLVHGVKCLSKLLQNYGDEIHPQRESAKQQSISWLNNEKLVAFVNKIAIDSDDDKQQVGFIRLEIEEINTKLISIYGDDVTLWKSLNPWTLKNQLQEKSNNAVDRSENIIDIKETHIEDNINSELTFNRASENLLAYLEKSGDWIKKISVSRAIKWASIKIPYNEEFVTKISAPRAEISLAVNNNQVAKSIDEYLSLYESYFMESGCQFYFDLQKREVDEAKKGNRPDIAQTIEDQIAILIKRVPNLIKLSFSDGTPFASQATRHWLNSINTITNDKYTESNPITSIQTKIDQILYNETGVELSDQISELDKIDVINESEKYLIQLAKVDACIATGRNDLALPLANYLNKLVDKYKLDEWNEVLALQTWSKLIQIISSNKSNTECETMRIDELKEKICSINMQFAVNRI
jgi:type VI secretion system protein VasJ